MGRLGGARRPQEHVEVLDQRFPLAVERSADLGSAAASRGSGRHGLRGPVLVPRLGFGARRTPAWPAAGTACPAAPCCGGGGWYSSPSTGSPPTGSGLASGSSSPAAGAPPRPPARPAESRRPWCTRSRSGCTSTWSRRCRSWMLRSLSINVSGLVVGAPVAAPRPAAPPRPAGGRRERQGQRRVFVAACGGDAPRPVSHGRRPAFWSPPLASTRRNSVPPLTEREYQKWSVSPIQLAAPGTSTTRRGAVLASSWPRW